MGEWGKLEAAKRAVVATLRQQPETVWVQVVVYDGTARLWDPSIYRQIGPSFGAGRAAVEAEAFSGEGAVLATGGADGMARLWDVSELPDNPERISTWVEVITGLGLDEMGSVTVLDTRTWRERREKLETQGGPPTTGPR